MSGVNREAESSVNVATERLDRGEIDIDSVQGDVMTLKERMTLSMLIS